MTKVSPVGICIIGLGSVGSALVRLIKDRNTQWSSMTGTPFRILAMADSSGLTIINESVSDVKTIDVAYDVLQHKLQLGSLSPIGPNLTYMPSFDVNHLSDILKQTYHPWVERVVVMDCTPPDYLNPETATSRIISWLNSGLDVVTANKSPLATAFTRIKAAASDARLSRGNVNLGFTATTGLTAPVASQLGGAFLGSQVQKIEGVLNGTSAHILSMMESGIEFSQALSQAQAQGIAEPNPTLDVDGWDTAAKLAILSSTLLNRQCSLNDVERTGISGLDMEYVKCAVNDGRKIHLVGRAEMVDGLRLSVKPEALEPQHPLASLRGTEKGLVVTSDLLGSITIRGGHSGVMTTAAVMARDMLSGL